MGTERLSTEPRTPAGMKRELEKALRLGYQRVTIELLPDVTEDYPQGLLRIIVAQKMEKGGQMTYVRGGE